jgi:transposase InsO family protein
MAVAVRGGQVPGVIFHTDQGSEGVHRAPVPQRLRADGIAQSMGRPGSALDNALQEACIPPWNSSCAPLSTSPPKPGPAPGSPPGSENYNTVRRHSALGMLSPLAYEQALAAGEEAA